jgi:hypothetical protein
MNAMVPKDSITLSVGYEEGVELIDMFQLATCEFHKRSYHTNYITGRDSAQDRQGSSALHLAA